MKTFLRYLLVGMVALGFAVTPLNQNFFNLTTTAFAQDQPDPKTELYKKFLDTRKTDRPAAYTLGKEYLQKYSADADQYVKYISDWVAKYDKEKHGTEIHDRFDNALKAKNYPEALTAGKVILGEEPDNLSIVIQLADAGYFGSKDYLTKGATTVENPLNADTLKYAQMAIDAIKAGKTPAANNWYPFKTKEETLSWMNYDIAFVYFKMMKDRDKDAAPYFFEALRYNDPSFVNYFEPYYGIAFYYQQLYQKAADDYKVKFGALKEDNADAKAARANLNGIGERAMDAYARAVKVARDPKSKTDPKIKDTLEKTLTEFYKIRKGNDTSGLDAYVTTTAAKPLIDPRSEITPIMEEATATTSVTNTTSTKVTSTGTATTPATTTKPATTTTTTKPATTTTTTTKPATTTPVKPTTTTKPTPKGKSPKK